MAAGEFPPEEIYKRIVARRAALGLSDNKASLLAGPSREIIRNIKRGHKPSYDKLVKLAEVLECTPGYLGGYTDDPSQEAEQFEFRPPENGSETSNSIRSIHALITELEAVDLASVRALRELTLAREEHTQLAEHEKRAQELRKRIEDIVGPDAD